MEEEFLESLSQGDLSVSIMSLQPAEDSEVISLFCQIPPKQQVPDQHQIMPSLKSKSKGQDQGSEGGYSHAIQGQKEKDYFSECNDGDYRLRKRRSKVVNLHDKKNKKRRTRVYIEMLQNRIQELSNQLQKLRKLNKMNKDYIKKISYSEQVVNGFFVGKQQIYQKIQSAIRQLDQQLKMKKQGIPSYQIQIPGSFNHVDSVKNKSFSSENVTMPSDGTPHLSRGESKLVQQIRTLRMRQGVFGVDRTKAINYYFRELVELLLPDVQKYIIQTIQQESDIFNPMYLEGVIPKQEEWRKQMLIKLGLSREQVTFLQSLKQPMLEEKAKFDTLLETFLETKFKLSQQARKMEIIFDMFSKKMSVSQIGNSLCYIQKFRFEKGISMVTCVKDVMSRLSKQEVSYTGLSSLFPHQKPSAS